MDIDLSQQGDPHWLSAKGKVNRDAIRAKHRKAHYLTRERTITPAKPETRAKLEAVLAEAREKALAKVKQSEAKIEAALQKAGGKDPHNKNIVAAFMQAIYIIDHTEPMIRDMIESDLMDVAGINRTKVKSAMTASRTLAQKIAIIRMKAIKKAFRYLRDNLPNDL